jgi:pimeloyl-ACP methyl ester carboxylesterase
VNSLRRTAALAALVLVAAGSGPLATFAAAPAAPAHCASDGVGKDSFCEVGGLRLHYVDWGGAGPAIVLLTGLGDSARVFDDFAPLLTGGHRVIAATRRGYGLSEAPELPDYSNDALVADVLGLLDGLGISRASFVGHSIAGGELAAIGSRHPDRVDRLIYIDAAYDRSRVPELMAGMPALPAPDAKAHADFDRMVAWRRSALGVDSPSVASNLSQVLVRGAAGWVPRTPPAVSQAVLAGDIGTKAEWSRIRSPSLALFTSKDVADQVPADASDSQRQAAVDYSIRRLRPWMLRAQADFIENSPCAVAVEVPRSTHYLFLERPEWTAEVVRSFLSGDDPCHWRAD